MLQKGFTISLHTIIHWLINYSRIDEVLTPGVSKGLVIVMPYDYKFETAVLKYNKNTKLIGGGPNSWSLGSLIVQFTNGTKYRFLL